MEILKNTIWEKVSATENLLKRVGDFHLMVRCVKDEAIGSAIYHKDSPLIPTQATYAISSIEEAKERIERIFVAYLKTREEVKKPIFLETEDNEEEVKKLPKKRNISKSAMARRKK